MFTPINGSDDLFEGQNAYNMQEENLAASQKNDHEETVETPEGIKSNGLTSDLF